MTAATEKHLSVGLRMARVYVLDANGYPAATSETVYEGIELLGAKTQNLNAVEPRKITHLGNDRALAIDFLPPNELPSGELIASVTDLTLKAILTAVKVRTLGEIKTMPWMTDKQGFEPSVGLLTFQQSLEKTTKVRNWRFHVMPSLRIFPLPAGMTENAVEIRYPFAPAPSQKHLWGEAMTESLDGATESPIVEGQSQGKPHLVAWKAAGATEFNYHSSRPCIQTYASKVSVWDNGTLVDPGAYTAAADGITFDYPPTTGHILCALYEY